MGNDARAARVQGAAAAGAGGRQSGAGAGGTNQNTDPANDGSVTFEQVAALAENLEHVEGPFGARITQLHHPDDELPESWSGAYGTATPMQDAVPGVVLSNGSKVLIDGSIIRKAESGKPKTLEDML